MSSGEIVSLTNSALGIKSVILFHSTFFLTNVLPIESGQGLKSGSE